MDAGVGEVMAHLQEKGLEEDTLVIFASDNGTPAWYPVPGNGALRGHKRQYYEGGMRVPMIVRWPGKVKAEVVCGEMISGMDVLPTVLAAAGVELPGEVELDGRNMLGVLKGIEKGSKERTLCWAGPMGSSSVVERRAVIKRAKKLKTSEYALYPPGWYVLRGKWKLIDPGTGKLALYNLENDIGEREDVAGEYPEKVRELRETFRKWIRTMPKPKRWDEEKWKKIRGA
jgi:uncharacterized sulfatase